MNKILLGLMIIGTFCLRAIPSWDKIFVDGKVFFQGVDSWYHMRIVDYMMQGSLAPLKWDMFAQYPNGNFINYHPLLDWIIVGFGQIFNYEVVGALLPPILGALTLIPIYFLGKELFGKGVGLMACLLVAVLPGEFMNRTRLGFTDHHALETLLMATVILFLILAYRHRDQKVYYPLSGLFLGLYILAWHGSPFLLYIIGIWFTIQFYQNYHKKKPVSQLCIGTSVTFAVALLLSFSILPTIFYTFSLVAGIVTPITLLLLTGLSRRNFYRASIVLGTTAAIWITLGFLSPYVWNIGWTVIILTKSVFWGFGTTIQEASPSDPQIIMATTGISFFRALGGLYCCTKQEVEPLFIVWAVILLLATIGQRRWGYYSIIPIALMASYFTFILSNWVKKDVRVATIIIICGN